MRESLYKQNRDRHRNNLYIRYRDEWRLEEPTIFQTIHWAKYSYYRCYIKDRVFNHNMVHGLCYGNFRNGYSAVKYKRQDYNRRIKWK